MVKETTAQVPQGIEARSAALRLVSEVRAGRLMSELGGVLDPLPPGERARAQRLALSVFRWVDRADRMLGPYLRLKPRDTVLNILRLGVVELCEDQAAPHGVINAMVTLTKSAQPGSKAPGLVNAVLRRVVKDQEKWQTLPVPRLPKKLRAPLVKTYGKHVVSDIEAAHVAGAPLDLTWRGAAPSDLRILGTLKVDALPTGSLRLAAPGQVSALPGYSQGTWWVQDAAAALPAQILDAKPDERVLDLCAAPGGKTMQLAASGAHVTALDISEARMARVTENLMRTKLQATCVVGDALDYEAPPFDAVLLDAPCSATGTIRRHPDLPIAKAGTDFGALFALQAAMVDKALALTRPGGRIVYCTCSLLPDEGEAQIDAALRRHPDLRLEAPDARGVEPEWRVPQGLRIRPDHWAERGGLDRFFIAKLRKSA